MTDKSSARPIIVNEPLFRALLEALGVASGATIAGVVVGKLVTSLAGG